MLSWLSERRARAAAFPGDTFQRAETLESVLAELSLSRLKEALDDEGYDDLEMLKDLASKGQLEEELGESGIEAADLAKLAARLKSVEIS